MSEEAKIYRGYNPLMNKGRLLEVCECGKTFSDLDALEAHRASKGYACAALMEEKLLKLKDEGERHLKCHYCAKLFKTEESRIIHEEKKHPVDPQYGRRMGRGY